MIEIVVALLCQDDLSVALELDARLLVAGYLLGDHGPHSDRHLHPRLGAFALIPFLCLNIHPINYIPLPVGCTPIDYTHIASNSIIKYSVCGNADCYDLTQDRTATVITICSHNHQC